MKKVKVGIVIPTLNEESNIESLLDSVPSKYRQIIVVADCDSTDNTANIARENGAVVVESKIRSYDHPCHLGSLRAIELGAEILVYLDAGGDSNPREIDLLLNPIYEDKADMTIGSRVRGKQLDMYVHQRVGTMLVLSLINFMFGERYTDIGPFRAVSVKCFNDLQMETLGFSYPTQMLVKTLKKKYRVMEVPVSSRKRVGKSKISGSIRKSLMAGRDMIWALRFAMGW